MKRKKLVVVEDEEDICHFYKVFFEANNYQVIPIQDGAAFSTFLKEEREVDFIIMDLDLPYVNGLATIRLMKKSEKESVKKIPIIVVTGYLNKCIAEELEKYNIKSLSKPPNLIEILREFQKIEKATQQS